MNTNETSSLPKELLKELRLQTRGAKQSAMRAQLKDAFSVLGEADLNQLLIYLYKKYNKIYKRSGVYSLLKTMLDEGKVKRVRTGTYSWVNTATQKPAAHTKKSPAKKINTPKSQSGDFCANCLNPIAEGAKKFPYKEEDFCSTKCILEYREK